MSYPGPGAQPTQLIVDGAPVSASNPLPIESTSSGAFAAATNQTLDLEKLDLRMEPGDVLAVALQTASSTATTNVSLNWHEE